MPNGTQHMPLYARLSKPPGSSSHGPPLCSAAQWEKVAVTATSDRECKTTKVCKATQWQTRAPSTTRNRRCSNLTVCEGDEYETKAATATSDRTCLSHSECGADQWESTAAGTHSCGPAYPRTHVARMAQVFGSFLFCWGGGAHGPRP